MYKILLCYAQTSTRREKELDEKERESKYIIYIERDCVRDKALLYKNEERRMMARRNQ